MDIGGTFTDLVLLDEQSGRLIIGKTLTTPEDPSDGVLRGLQQLLEHHDIQAEALTHTVHATTLVTNAIIERKGCKTGLITTAGFRDVLETRRELRYDLYDIFLELPPPLAPRHLCREVRERIRGDGTVRAPLSADDVRLAARELVESGVESVAIVLLHSYINSTHEEEAHRIIAESHPRLLVSSSHQIAREIREYERASTTVANAYVKPMVSRYIGQLEARLRETGFRGRLYMMVSAGGISSAETARELPITLTESGPAAGALVGGFYGRLSGERHVLAFDMGGTTAKACLVDDGQPLVTYGFETGRVQRFKKGSGLPLKIPAVELIEIGAGGGSIARVDRLGLLKVGPDSAGASPGPACYGRGGRQPTVTDADLLLGYLNPDYFLGGEMGLDVDAARRALELELARPLDRSVLEIAWGIHEIVNENMASAARVHIAERGRDPRKYTLVATGGAGPVHACRIARKLRLPRVLCPLGSGVASTIGLLVAQPQTDIVHAYVSHLDRLDWDRLNQIYQRMRHQAAELLEDLGVSPDAMTLQPSADLRYVGQGFEVLTPLPPGPYRPESASAFAEAFEAAYRALYGHAALGLPVEGLNWRLRASGPPTDADQVAAALRARNGTAHTGDVRKGERPAYFPELAGFAPTPVYDRYRLRPDSRFVGPAIVEERESTVLVSPGVTFRVDEYGTLIMDLGNTDQGG